ncbi:DUF2326 domain-containing protein [Arcanobacterium ihumii]|uniref:DUF2326 domain-containing protein n=1 Tax=Arcanobacterium ihumii TaxID=2138162 RepID=UPI000F537B2F|nr:DUF2326 domain-containing protein [Arcanobacterium ihumii]
MLVRLWSPAFKIDGNSREPIEFRPGLNLVEGGAEAENSIGKSTVLEIIDFAYGGKRFLSSDAVRLPQAVGHHPIYFTIRLSGVDFHYSRDTSRPDLIQPYIDKNWTTPAGEALGIDEYLNQLLTAYGLNELGTSFRDLVGRFCRVDVSELSLLDYPLASVPQEPAAKGAAALLRLLNVYQEIEKTQRALTKAQDEKKLLNSMAKSKLSRYISITKKAERQEAEDLLQAARNELARHKVKVDLELFEERDKAEAEQQQLRAQLRPIETSINAFRGRLAAVNATLNGESRITTDDLEHFYEYFPNANKELLETVEMYHHKLVGILREQLLEQQQLYETSIAALQAQASRVISSIHALGESVELDDEIYQESGELVATIRQYEQQIEMFDKTQAIEARRKELKAELEQAIPRKLNSLAAAINDEMREFNRALYPDTKRLPPILSFKLGRNAVTYDFDHNGDTGAGNKSKNLILLDLAILQLTPLPFLIHDSALTKQIAFDPVRNLLSLYEETRHLESQADEPKQVFYSFDAAKAYGETALGSVENTRVIKLGEGPHALYGFTWNVEKEGANK